ncbi:jg19346, partial [Pararge aegeria aegeria]
MTTAVEHQRRLGKFPAAYYPAA